MRHLIFWMIFLISFNAISNQLRIGTLTTNPPFEMQYSDHHGHAYYFGFEIELMDMICANIGYQCHYQSVNFHHLPDALNNNEIDLALGMIIITPERMANFAFSQPYAPSYFQFVTLKENHFKTIDDLEDKIIGVYHSSPSLDYMNANFSGNTRVKTYPHSEALYDALASKEVDAILASLQNALFWTEHLSADFVFLGNKISYGDGYGVMMRKDNESLVQLINQALDKIEQNGNYVNLYNNYLISSDD